MAMNKIKQLLLACLLVCSATAYGAKTPFYKVEPVELICAAANNQDNYNTSQLKANWQVVEGSDGGLFITSRDLRADFELTSAAVTAVMRFNQALSSQGIKLVLAYIPSRGLISPRVPIQWATETRTKARQSYRRALEQFRSAGITVPKLESLLFENENFFYKRDFHWTPAGAKLTAKVVADSLYQMGYKKRDAEAVFTSNYAGVAAPYASTQRATEQLCSTKLPVQYTPFYATTASDDTVNMTEDALFGNTDNPNITIIGTSFSANERFNFSGALQEFSNISVSNFAVTSGADIGAWQAYLKSSEFTENPPDVVVWELPSYYPSVKEGKTFSFLTPLLHDGCTGQDVYLQNKHVSFGPGGQAEGVIFSDGSNGVASKNLVLDIAVSTPQAEKLRVTAWFGSGQSREYTPKAISEGRFIFELGNGRNGDEALIGLDIDSVGVKGVDVEVGAEDDFQFEALRAEVKLCQSPYPYSDQVIVVSEH